MNPSLLVFQSRESGFLNYRVPANDVLDDAGERPTESLAAPELLEVVLGTVTFSTVEGATEYIIERRVEGGEWTSLASIEDEGSAEIAYTDLGGVIQPAFYRVIAYDIPGDRTSIPSNVILLEETVDESSAVDYCNLGVPESMFNTAYRIASYVPGSIQNPNVADGAPEWDGTFAYRFIGGTNQWVSGEPNQFALDGNLMCRASIRFVCSGTFTTEWHLTIYDNNYGANIYLAIKSGGNTPAGVYQGYPLQSGDPLWIRIEEMEGGTTLAVSEECNPI